MKKYNTYKIFIIVGLLIAFSNTQASISLGLSEPVQTGNSISFDVIMSGLGTDSAPSLGSYDLDVGFDTSHIVFSDAAFGDPVIGNQLDLFDFGINESGNALNPAGALNIYEISLDSIDDLNDFQADVFTLATLTFNVLKSGSSQLSFVIHDLGDAEGNVLAADLSTATITTVPVPAAFWLMFSGLIGFYRVRANVIQVIT